MKTEKFPKEVLEVLTELSVGDKHDGYTLRYSGEWEDQGKFQTSQIVFEFNGQLYDYDISRWGSYYNGYEFFFGEDETNMVKCRMVKAVEKVVIEYVPI